LFTPKSLKLPIFFN